MKKLLFYILIACLLTSISSCEKFVEVGPPSNRIASSTVFLTEETAIAAVNGIYSSMASSSNQSFAAGGATVFLGLYADELTTVLTGATLEFSNSKIAPTNGTSYNGFWRYPYQLIYHANSTIAGLQNAPIPISTREQLLGETYFVRAFCYWYLVNLMGDVPLVLNADDYNATTNMSRTEASKIIQQVLDDLARAKALLKPIYPSQGRYRANYYTVLGFLSRVHLYLGNWNEVITSSNEIISQTNTYSLEPDLNKVFLIGSNEAIWQTANSNLSTNSHEGQYFVPFPGVTARPNYSVQQGLYDAFSINDKRKTNWIATKIVSGITYRYPYKYKVQMNTVKTECQMMIRLAEIYLNRAEAKAKLGDATAVDDLNKIRNRSGLPNIVALSGQALIDTIIRERRLELFAEWGLRFFDLKRTNQLDATLGPLKSGWVPTGALLPIPQTEILVSPNLSQNPGYN